MSPSLDLISLLSRVRFLPASSIVLPVFPIIPDTVLLLSTVFHVVDISASICFLGYLPVISYPLNAVHDDLSYASQSMTSFVPRVTSVILLPLYLRFTVLSSMSFSAFRYVPSTPCMLPATFSMSFPPIYAVPPLLIIPMFLMLSVTDSTSLIFLSGKNLLLFMFSLYFVTESTVLSFRTFPFSDISCMADIPSIFPPILWIPPLPSIYTSEPDIRAPESPMDAFVTCPPVDIYTVPVSDPICDVFISSPAFITVPDVPDICDGFRTETFLLSISTPSSLLYVPLRYSSVPFTTLPDTSRYTSEPVISPPAPRPVRMLSASYRYFPVLYTFPALIWTDFPDPMLPPSLFITSPSIFRTMMPSDVILEPSDVISSSRSLVSTCLLPTVFTVLPAFAQCILSFSRVSSDILILSVTAILLCPIFSKYPSFTSPYIPPPEYISPRLFLMRVSAISERLPPDSISPLIFSISEPSIWMSPAPSILPPSPLYILPAAPIYRLPPDTILPLLDMFPASTERDSLPDIISLLFISPSVSRPSIPAVISLPRFMLSFPIR